MVMPPVILLSVVFLLRNVHTDILSRSPFGGLLNLEGVKLHKAILTTLVRSWIPKSRAFRVGGIVVPFEVKDVALALGLSLKGDRIRIDWHSTEEVEGWRFGSPTARFAEIAKVIRAESMSDEILSIQATVRHVLLLLCCSVLFAHADATDHKTKSCIFPYLEAETIRRIGWAYPVYDFLIESLDSYSKKGMGYINGCAILLQVWLFEHTTLWEPSVPDARPRLLKWTSRIDTRMKEQTTLITLIRDRKLKKKEVLKCLLPIPEEESLLSIVADDVDNLDDPLLPREEGQRQSVVEDDVLDVENVLIEKRSTPISVVYKRKGVGDKDRLQDIHISEEETIASLSLLSNVAVKRRRWTKKETDKEKNKVDGEEKPISRAELNFIVGRLRQLEDEVVELEDEVAELKRKLAEGDQEAEGEQEAEGQDGDEGGGR
ncbi:uncharacterized protein LOC143875939 [Tasmannia lanceolata]|uniref:uncharacterized protein LOC143875939 n=1 Tax=Tasmannia lanceolata TaxID=3420 RepID=UPI004062D940